MKKKFFSKLLMGALLVATVSSYVSCKDYDDDIANLQAQIDAKAALTELEALKAQIASVESSAKSALEQAVANLNAALAGKADAAATQAAIAAVQGAADQAGQDAAAAMVAAAAAQNTADAANTAAGNAQASADAANAAAGKAQNAADAAAAAAAKAQTTADAALKAAQDADQAVKDAAAAATEQITKALEGVASKDDLASLEASIETKLKAIGDNQSNYATADALANAVKELEAKINAMSGTGSVSGSSTVSYQVYDPATDSWKETTGTLDEAMAYYTSTITSLNAGVNAIWGAVTSVSLYVAGGEQTHGNRALSFLNTIEKATINFPAGEHADKKVTGDDVLSFTENKKVTYVDTIVVRVSPVSAQLKSEMVSLINSQGVEIDKSLISVEVFPYTKVLTRAEANKSGLWKIAFKLKDDYTKEEFKNVALSQNRDVLFAVAINNTLEDDAERRVISEYDLYLTEGSIAHAWDFVVNDDKVSAIHNRWSRCDDGTSTRDVEELGWVKEPAVEVTDDNSADRVTGTYNDNRQYCDILNAEIGKPITIDFRNMLKDYSTRTRPIRGFYVTLDHEFALESVPSELNAWISYSYENVGVIYRDRAGELIVKQAAKLFEGNTGTITINNTGNVRGDVIGFRVYAVNYDGTLYDPDGRAFYVHVGEVVEDKELPGNAEEAAELAIDVEVFQNYGDSAVYELKDELKNGAFFTKDANQWTVPVWADGNPYLADYPSTTFYTPIKDTRDQFVQKGSGSTAIPIGNLGVYNMFEIWYATDKRYDYTTSPSADTKYVKVVLKNAMAMLDNEIYKVVITGQNVTAGGYVTEDLEKITIKIRKVLPTSIPEFTTKMGQAGNILPLKVYMKPANYPYTLPNTTNIWNVQDNENHVVYGQDIKPFDFADIFNGLQAPLASWVNNTNYSFEIENSDVKNSDNSLVSTTASWGWQTLANGWSTAGLVSTARGAAKDSYSVPFAAASVVAKAQNEAPQNKVIVHYTYNNLSLVENNGYAKWEDVDVKEDWSSKFKVSYTCALDMDRIQKIAAADFENYYKNVLYPGTTMTSSDIRTKEMPKYFQVAYEQQTWDFDLNLLWWNEQGAGRPAYLGLTNPGYDNHAELPAGKQHLTALFSDHYLEIADVKLSNEDYFTVTNWNSQVVTLEKTRSTEDPALTADQKVNLVITCKDVFGHNHVITQELTILKPVPKSARSL